MAAPAVPAPASAGGPKSPQWRWLEAACGSPVEVRLTDGEEIRGILRAHDTYALIIDRGDAQVLPELIYKHGISLVSMAPSSLAAEGKTDE